MVLVLIGYISPISWLNMGIECLKGGKDAGSEGVFNEGVTEHVGKWLMQREMVGMREVEKGVWVCIYLHPESQCRFPMDISEFTLRLSHNVDLVLNLEGRTTWHERVSVDDSVRPAQYCLHRCWLHTQLFFLCYSQYWRVDIFGFEFHFCDASLHFCCLAKNIVLARICQSSSVSLLSVASLADAHNVLQIYYKWR